MKNIKDLTGFTVISTGGADVLSYTYDEIDEKGNMISMANQARIKVIAKINPELSEAIEKIKNHIEENLL